MKKLRKNQLTAMVLLSMFGVVMTGTSYAYDEYHDNYTLNEVVVTAKNAVNRFGDTKTEQSYYRTGGDVKVITRDEIEKRHYADLTDAIKRIPGITFQNPGYRGGEYGYEFYNNGVSINGDSRVIILVDGRRVDNASSTRIGDSSADGSKSTGVNLDQLTDINNVDKIEVIKGPGASAYGSDATGGVINIITRRGGDKTQVTTDVSYGNWGKQTQSFTYSGPVSTDKKTKVFIQGSRVQSDDTHYIDGLTKEDATLYGSHYKEKGADIRITKDYDENRSLDVSFNYKSGRDGYPIATPNMKHWNQKDWDNIIFQSAVGVVNDKGQLVKLAKRRDIKSKMTALTAENIKPHDVNGKEEPGLVPSVVRGDGMIPGYHNLFALDGKYDSYSKFNNKDLSVTYTLKKDHNLPTFIRGYYQHHYFANRDFFAWYDKSVWTKENPIWKKFFELYPNGSTLEQRNAFAKEYLAPFPGNSASMAEWIAKTGGPAGPVTGWYIESNYGVQGQYAKVFTVGNKRHDVIAEATYDMAKTSSYSANNNNITSSTNRNTFSAYVQDKIHMDKDWLLTPAIRFVHYSGFTNKDEEGTTTVANSSASALTGALNTEFNITPTLSGYVGITNIYRPLRPGDYSTQTEIGGTLQNEKGMAYTLGFRKFINEDKTSIGVNYALIDMSNAIATLPIIRDNTEQPVTGVVNAKDRRQSINITIDHSIGEHWMLSAAYTHLNDKWSAKGFSMPSNYEQFTSVDDINTQINKLTPKHRYSLNVAYTDKKLYTGLLMNLYAGNNTNYFTAKNFLVVDWSMNYAFNKNLTAYAVVNNLTNTAYQLSYSAYNGIDSASMPARNYMFGLNYKF